MTFDSSAFIAQLDHDEANHLDAKRLWNVLLDSNEELLSTNYVVVETYAVLQRKLGMDGVIAFSTNLLPLVELAWVDERTHSQAVRTFIEANRRWLSLVDCTSFRIMQHLGIPNVFCFDPHFAEQGFNILKP